MSVINTNITALIGQANLQKSQSALQTSMERLSSGLRINSAKDDAAGQAIANRMTSQITGLAQAQRNANDGISVAQTAEGALNQVNDNLQRIRELTVQAQNGTNSSSDLQSIQDEITQRLGEVDRISRETSFNGVKVLASGQELSIQVGANDGERITLNLQEISSSTLNLSSFDVSKTFQTSALSETATTATVAASVSVTELTFADTNAGGALTLVADGDNADSLYVADASGNYFTATYDGATNTISYDTSENLGAGVDLSTSVAGVVNAEYVFDGDQMVSVGDVAGFADSATAPSIEVYGEAGGTDFWVSTDSGTTFFTAAINFETGVVTWNSAEVNGINPGADPLTVGDTTAGALTEIVAYDGGVEIDMSGVDTALVGDNAEVFAFSNGNGYVVKGEVDGNAVYYAATVDEATGAVTLGDQMTADPLSSLDNALSDVDRLRSDLGAAQNRFEDAITNLQTNQTNLAAARSRIEDADYAVEVSNLTRAQILQQAGTSVLAQANQVPQTVLSLLR